MILNNIDNPQSTYCAIIETDFSEYKEKPHRLNGGSIFCCNKGSVTVSINLELYKVESGSIFFLFPHDIIEVKEITDDFCATIFIMSSDLMGEASSRLEHFIFEKIHSYPHIVSTDDKIKIFFGNMIENIKLYSEISDMALYKDFALLQVRSLFLVLTDYVNQNYENEEPRTYSRLEEHFKSFMGVLTKCYKMSREVSYYAYKMNITPKYLNYIVQTVSHRTCKSLIDAYIIMQLKLELRNTEKAVQEIAYEYNFPNQSFLGSYFKKFVGSSPRSFRNGEH